VVKLLVVASLFPRDPWDPEGSFILDQSLVLAARGHEVRVLVVERRAAPRRNHWGALAAVRSARYLAPPLSAGVGAWSRAVHAALRHLSSSFAGFGAALVHDELVAVAVQPFLDATRIPWVLVVHGENRNPAMSRASGLRAKNDVYGRASAVITVGEGVGLPLWVSVKEHRIPNGAGVPAGTAEPPARTARVMALSVSGLRTGKGIEDNLAALAQLRDEGVQVGYWIAGEGHLRAELEALTDRLRLRDRVRFLGTVPRDHLAALLGAADFFALPSSPEAFGIAYVEAMQAGLPVIACRGEGPAGFVRNGVDGYLVMPRDHAGIASAWRSLSTDDDLRSRMGATAQRTAAAYTWAANAERVEAVLDHVVTQYRPQVPGRDLCWLGVEPTSYMLDKAEAVRGVIPDVRRAFIDGGGDVSTTQLFAAIVRRRAKVLLLEGWGAPRMLVAMALAVLARVPFIVASDTHEAAGGRRGLLRTVVRTVAIRPLVRRAAVLFPGGTPQARYVRELVGNDRQALMIAHMTVDTDGFARAAREVSPQDRAAVRSSWGCGDGDIALLFVGRLVQDKGLLLLVRALERLRDVPIRLVVYGAGPLESELRRSAERLPIHLAGVGGKEELASAYASADVFVLPSLFEPWGLVVNEAMASGLPCVVSDAVGSSEDLIIAGDTGSVFPSRDVAALAEAVRRLAEDASLRRRMGVEAQRRMQDWSMSTYAASVERAVTIAKGTAR
jgi:glycosyltransferase involved in cell wall biosynthesis